MQKPLPKLNFSLFIDYKLPKSYNAYREEYNGFKMINIF